MPFRLVPPLRGQLVIRFVPCSMRSTGRPRPIPDDGSTRLRTKVYRRDVLWRAWVAVRVNDGAPGIDQSTLDQVERYGITRHLTTGDGESVSASIAGSDRAARQVARR